jgi:hypothetical protein
MFVGGTMMAEIASLYVLITSSHQLPLPAALFFLVVAIDFAIFIHVIFKSLCRPYLASVAFLKHVGKLGKRDKYLVRFLRSCSPLKLSMGDGTFFDRLTSLVIWEVCVGLLVNLLVM